MSIIDTTEIDFSQNNAPEADGVIRHRSVVRNSDVGAALHVILTSDAPWLEVYPHEFALAPHESQTVTAELQPSGMRGTLAPARIALHGQYLEETPRSVDAEVHVLPPTATCPSCGAELAQNARECRRCGERIRPCPVCGTPNTWIARACRRNPAHLLRTGIDWRMTPAGDASHSLALTETVGVHLARLWSAPAFPVIRAEDAVEWSAPLAAFGMVIASAIEPKANRATIQAFALTNGEALWDFDLPDPRGIYPDRGAMALSEEGHLYAATLGGSVVALDAIRGTRQWEAKLSGAVYGGVTVAGPVLLVPAGDSVCVLDRLTGALLKSLTVGGRLDSAPAFADGCVFVSSDDSSVRAFHLETGGPLWKTPTDGPFDASPIVRDQKVYAATMAGTVYALDASTGQILWKTSASTRPIAVTPALSADGLLFAAADDGFVHIIASETGSLIRSRRVSGSALRTAPVCSGHTVFLGTDEGHLYTLDEQYNIQRAYETTAGARMSSASPAIYGDILACTATNGVLYVLRAQ